MGQFLSSPVKIQGISRNKIIVVGAIILLALSSAVLFGVFENNDVSTANSNYQAETKYNNTDTTSSINQIINDADNNKQKLAASALAAQAPVTVKNAKSTAVESQDINVSVPPIVTLKDKRANPSQSQQKFEQQQDEHKYTSYTAKSLMFSRKIGSDGSASTPLGASTVGNKSVNSGNVRDAAASAPTDEVSAANGAHAQRSQDYLDASLQSARSPYEVKAGSVIPATMINGLNSDLPGQVVAQVRENVYDSASRKYLLIPQGAKLVGLYDSNVAYGQQRIMVAWNRLIYPDGSSINLKAMPGTDLEGYAGFHDLVDNKYWQIFGTSFVMGVISAGMQYSQNNTNSNVQIGGLGISSNPTVGQSLAGSLGQQLGQTGLAVAQKNLNVAPTIIIRPNYPFNIMITADMVLKPYPIS